MKGEFLPPLEIEGNGVLGISFVLKISVVFFSTKQYISSVVK